MEKKTRKMTTIFFISLLISTSVNEQEIIISAQTRQITILSDTTLSDIMTTEAPSPISDKTISETLVLETTLSESITT